MMDVYLNRAVQLSRARELVREDASYASATALLAVHFAITMTDVLLISMNGARSKGQDHTQAVSILEKACSSRKIATGGVRHLRALLSAKTDVSYGDKSVTLDLAQALANKSQLFEVWAFEALQEVK